VSEARTIVAGFWRRPAEHPESIDFVSRQQASVTHKQIIYG